MNQFISTERRGDVILVIERFDGRERIIASSTVRYARWLAKRPRTSLDARQRLLAANAYTRRESRRAKP